MQGDEKWLKKYFTLILKKKAVAKRSSVGPLTMSRLNSNLRTSQKVNNIKKPRYLTRSNKKSKKRTKTFTNIPKDLIESIRHHFSKTCFVPAEGQIQVGDEKNLLYYD